MRSAPAKETGKAKKASNDKVKAGKPAGKQTAATAKAANEKAAKQKAAQQKAAQQKGAKGKAIRADVVQDKGESQAPAMTTRKRRIQVFVLVKMH